MGEKQQHPRAHISRISTKIPLFTISCFDYHLGTKKVFSCNDERHFNQSIYLLDNFILENVMFFMPSAQYYVSQFGNTLVEIS